MNADELCELFGFATSLYTLVSREDKSNQISDDFDLKADLVKLLRGHYLTGSEILLRDFADEYSQKLLHIAEPLSEKLDILNYANTIAAIYDSIPDTDSSLVIDEGSSLDRSEILDDFETYSLKMKSLHAEE